MGGGQEKCISECLPYGNSYNSVNNENSPDYCVYEIIRIVDHLCTYTVYSTDHV